MSKLRRTSRWRLRATVVGVDGGGMGGQTVGAFALLLSFFQCGQFFLPPGRLVGTVGFFVELHQAPEGLLRVHTARRGNLVFALFETFVTGEQQRLVRSFGICRFDGGNDAGDSAHLAAGEAGD